MLSNSICEFSDKTYKEIRGTIIGTALARPYAIRFLAALEEKIFDRVKKKWSVCWGYIDNKKQSVWWGYIDDVFCIL